MSVLLRYLSKAGTSRHLAGATCLALCSTPAWAYIDPGSGAMLVQALLALLASVLFYFDKFRKIVWNLIRRIFGKKQ